MAHLGPGAGTIQSRFASNRQSRLERTLRRTTPFNAVDGSPIGTGRPGPITKRLQKAYFDLAMGVSGEHPEWISEA